MRLPYLIAIALLAGTGLGSSVSAKSLAEGSSPVNFPPSDFAGGSFVDNDGCVYIRAGVDGNTTWVPRVARNRQVICGQRPTFGATRQAAAPAPAAPAPQPRQAAAAPAPAPAPVAQPRTQTRQAAAPTPAPVTQPTRTVRRVVTSPAPARQAPAPTAVRRVAPAPVLAAPTSTITVPGPSGQGRRVVSSGCTNMPATSQRFINTTGVRCGPQAESPSSGWSTRTTTTGGSRVVASLPPVPQGYRRAWDDGRLNPQRGIPGGNAQALAGQRGVVSPVNGRRYDLAWTRQQPHLLYDRITGMVVGDQFPGLTYPNTVPTAAPQVQARTVATQSAPRATISTRAPAPQATRVVPRAAKPAAVAAPQAPVNRALVNRHIQVATFADMGQAKAAAQRLANAGMPTRIGKYTSGGQARQVIVLGPFSSQAQVNRALGQTRSLGFGGAFARK